MTRALLLTVLVLGLAVLGLAVKGDDSARGGVLPGGVLPEVVLHVGDVMTVDGAPIGCKIATRDGRPVIDCRRAGPLKGTYGTLFDEKRVRVVRFRSNDTAKVVYKARHGGKGRRCDRGARAR
jgi:hypothetical protein